MKKQFLQTAFAILASIALLSAQAQVLSVTQTPVDPLVQNVLLGTGVSVFNITFQGNPAQFGTFNGEGTNLGLDFGVILATGNISVAVGPNNSGSASVGVNPAFAQDADLAQAAGTSITNIRDKAILEFDFVPLGDTVSFRYVFGSEEYNEYVCSSFNDVFGFFLSGPGISGPYSNGAINIATVPGTTLPVAINTVNIGQIGSNGSPGGCPAGGLSNAQFFVNNPPGSPAVQFDGFTTVLTAKSAVQCGQTYHIKIAISDVFDGAFDSGVFLEAYSFSSEVVQVNIINTLPDSSIVEGCTSAQIEFTRPSANNELTITYDVGGTATPGVDYIALPGFVTFPEGVFTVSVPVIPLVDGEFEPFFESIIITVYNLTPCGDTIETVGIIYIKEEYEILVSTTDITITCPQPNVQLTAQASNGVEPYTYTWLTVPPQTGQTITVPVISTNQYVVMVKDLCDNMVGYDTVTVTVNAPPPLGVTASNDTLVVCPGDNVLLTSLANDGTPPYNYVWSNGDPFPSSNFQVFSDTAFVVSVTDFCGFPTVTDTVFVALQYLPLKPVNIDTALVCPGDSLAMVAAFIGGLAPYTFNWPSIGVADDSVKVSVPNSQTYVFTVSDACNLSANGSYAVEIPEYEPIFITVDDSLFACQGQQIVLSASASLGAGIYTYAWQGPNNPLMIDDSSAVVVPPFNGVIYVINVVDQCNNIASDSVEVTVIDCSTLIANIITVNGDGLNDTWKIANIEFYPNNKVWIYNRWGNLVYEAAPYNNAWNGDKLPSGTYFFIVDLGNGSEIQKGTLTIIKSN